MTLAFFLSKGRFVSPLRQSHRELLAILFIGCLTLDLPAQVPPQPPTDRGSSVVTFSFNEREKILPVKIVSVMFGDREIPLNTPIPLSGMWMSKIRVIARNISSKTIVQGEVVFLFPEIKNQGTPTTPVQAISFRLGRLPEHALMQPDGTVQKPRTQPPQINIAPGSQMEFVNENHSDIDAIQVQSYKLVGRISKVQITMAPIYFSDGSKWMADKFFVPVPPPGLWRETMAAGFFVDVLPAKQ